MTFSFNTQRVAAVARQILAVAVSIVGILSANNTIMGSLPKWVSGILVAFGPVLLTVEHYVGDVSTGTPAMPAPAPPPHAAAAAPPATPNPLSTPSLP